MKATKYDFAQASKEISRGEIDDGLFAMARSQALGDEEKAWAIYVGLRAEEISHKRVGALAQSTFISVKHTVKAWLEQVPALLTATFFSSALIYGVFLVVVQRYGTTLSDTGLISVATFFGFVIALNWVEYRKNRRGSRG